MGKVVDIFYSVMDNNLRSYLIDDLRNFQEETQQIFFSEFKVMTIYIFDHRKTFNRKIL